MGRSVKIGAFKKRMKKLRAKGYLCFPADPDARAVLLMKAFNDQLSRLIVLFWDNKKSLTVVNLLREICSETQLFSEKEIRDTIDSCLWSSLLSTWEVSYETVNTGIISYCLTTEGEKYGKPAAMIINDFLKDNKALPENIDLACLYNVLKTLYNTNGFMRQAHLVVNAKIFNDHKANRALNVLRDNGLVLMKEEKDSDVSYKKYQIAKGACVGENHIFKIFQQQKTALTIQDIVLLAKIPYKKALQYTIELLKQGKVYGVEPHPITKKVEACITDQGKQLFEKYCLPLYGLSLK